MEYSPKLKISDSSHQGETGKGISKLAIICAVVAVIAVVMAALLFVQNRHLQKKTDTSKSTSQTEVTNEEVAKKVAAVYDAPNEKPSVARVADKSKLPNEPFFQNAKQGDYVLIYPKAKIALIYRMSENKVVNIGPISAN